MLSGKYYEEYKKQIKPGSHDYDLYHKPENSNIVLGCMIMSPIFFFFAGTIPKGIMWMFVICGGGYILRRLNNWTLDNDPQIQKSRKFMYILYLQKRFGSDWEKYL